MEVIQNDGLDTVPGTLKCRASHAREKYVPLLTLGASDLTITSLAPPRCQATHALIVSLNFPFTPAHIHKIQR